MTYKEFIEKHKVSYCIFRLHKQGKAYKELSQQFNLSVTRLTQRNRTFLYSVAKFYYQQLKQSKLEPLSFCELYDYYANPELLVAYYEKTYKQELDVLRHGESPLLLNSVDLPKFRKLSEKEILQLEIMIFKAIKNQHKKYRDIAKELKISKEKAQWIYHNYMNKKVIEAIQIIKKTEPNIENFVYSYSISPIKRWNLIVSKYPDIALKIEQE